MGASDGTVQGLTQLLDNGPASQRCNIVLVAEGFQASELSDFADACDSFVTVLKAENWYPVLGKAINVYRLDVASDASGPAHPPPSTHPPHPAVPSTSTPRSARPRRRAGV